MSSYLFPQRALRVARHMDIHNHVTFRTLLAEDSGPDRCAYFFVLFADVLTKFFVRSQVR